MKKLSVHLKNLVIVYFNTYLIIMVASYAMTGISRDAADILRMHSLLLLPAYLYLIRTRIHHLLPFILAHLLAAAPILIYALPGNIYGMVIMGAAIAIFVFHSFVLKLTDTKNETSVGGALVLCGAMTVGYFCADIQGFEIGPLVHPYLMGAAAAMILFIFIDMHTRNVDSTLNNVNEMLNQPAQKIRRFNNKILIYFVAATAVFVILALVFRLDRVIVAVGNALLWIIRFLVSLIPHGQTVQEESSIIAEESSKASGDTIQLVGGEAAAIWEFLEMIVTIAVFAALIIGLLYGLYRFYKWFYSRKMGEVVADEYEESSVYMEKEEKAVRRREPILERFRMTNEKRIRRMYRKRLEEPMKKEQIHPSDAPGEILQILHSEELKTLTPLYEKARYSQNPISKEELKKQGDKENVRFLDSILTEESNGSKIGRYKGSIERKERGKIMKRLIAMMCAVLLAVSAVGCSGNNPQQNSSVSTAEESSKEESLAAESSAEESLAEQSSAAEESPVAEESSDVEDSYVVRVAALKGPTGMGLAKLMDENTEGTSQNQYEFTLASAPDEILASIIKGEYDIAAVPTNVASILYNKTEGKVQMAALNTLGVLYVVTTDDSITSIADLAGRTVYSSGQGAVPEIVFNYILEKNGLTAGTDVTVEYRSEHSELAALMASGEAEIAVLPQPFVTSVLMQNDKVHVALDLTEEWDKVTNGENQMTMGCIVVQKAFAEEHPEEMAAFMKEYQASVEYITDEANLEDAAALIEKADIIKAAIAQKALPECNIVFIDGQEMQQIASGFLQVLFDSNPAMVGGKLPDEDLYYQGSAE